MRASPIRKSIAGYVFMQAVKGTERVTLKFDLACFELFPPLPPSSLSLFLPLFLPAFGPRE